MSSTEMRFHYKWKMKEGDREGLTVFFNFDLEDYDEWAGQIRPGPAPTTPVVDLRVDVSRVDEQRVRFWLDNGEVLATFDGYEGDLQVVNPDGGVTTFGDLEIEVEPQFTA